jgi:hypothetical protein
MKVAWAAVAGTIAVAAGVVARLFRSRAPWKLTYECSDYCAVDNDHDISACHRQPAAKDNDGASACDRAGVTAHRGKRRDPRDKTRHTLCQVVYDKVSCLGHFTDPVEGKPANLVAVDSAGVLQYGIGDADESDVGVRLDYRTYHALDWTIVADETGTTFTNDRTHHGM